MTKFYLIFFYIYNLFQSIYCKLAYNFCLLLPKFYDLIICMFKSIYLPALELFRYKLIIFLVNESSYVKFLNILPKNIK